MKILLLSGHSATGKTSAARAVAQKFDCELLLEREIIDRVVERKGFRRARDCLKKFGFDSLLKEAREETLKSILSSGKENIILDGAYDGKIPDYLRANLKGAEFRIVGVCSNKSMRRHRMMQRSGLPKKEALRELRFIDGIKERMGAHKVVMNADIKVKNKGRFHDFLSRLEEIASSFFGNKNNS